MEEHGKQGPNDRIVKHPFQRTIYNRAAPKRTRKAILNELQAAKQVLDQFHTPDAVKRAESIKRLLE